MAAGETVPKRDELVRRLRQLETEFAQVQTELAAIGPGEELPGLFLVIEVAGRAAAVSVAQVTEIVRLLEFAPLPGAPAHVLGSFLYRGEPVIAVDLAGYLGERRELPIDSHVIVLRASRPIALAVDRVRALAEGLRLAPEGTSIEQWSGSRVVGSLCRCGDELLPVLSLEPLLEGVHAP